MKTILLISVLLIFSYFELHSQTLNYDETVNYITAKLKTHNQSTVNYKCEINSYGLISEEFKPDWGKLEIMKKSVNINDIGKIELIHADENDPNIYFIRFYCKNGECANIFGNYNKVYFTLFTASEEDAQRLLKAFIHLKKLAQNTKDPFD